ncbi:hypothetical protein ACFL3Z_02405 [Gemmatimonadota bacterium]
MKMMIRLAALVTILCALPATQVNAQIHQEPPGVNSFGWLTGFGVTVDPTGQPVLVAVFTGGGTASFPAGSSRRSVVRAFGGYLTSILIKAGIISFQNGQLVIEDPPEPAPLPEEVVTPPGNGG